MSGATRREHCTELNRTAMPEQPTKFELLNRLEAAEQAVKRVEKLLKDAEEVEAIMPSRYDKLWISSVRNALHGSPANGENE